MENMDTKDAMPGISEQNDFEERWPEMHRKIVKKFRQEDVSAIEWAGMMSSLNYHCLRDREVEKTVYEALHEEVRNSVKQVEQKLSGIQEDDLSLISTYAEEWQKFCFQCDYFPTVFVDVESAVERYAHDEEKNLYGNSILVNMLCDNWNEIIFSKLFFTLLHRALNLLNAERRSDVTDSQLSPDIFRYFFDSCHTFYSNNETDPSYHLQCLQSFYLADIAEFYSSKSSLYIEEYGIRKYMRYAEKKLEEEDERAFQYLDAFLPSLGLVKECTVELLVADVKDRVLENCPEMMRNNEAEELRLMYKLMNMIPDGVDPMARDFKDHIMKQVLSEMMSSADIISQVSGKYIELLEKLFNGFSKLAKDVFNDDPRFLTSRNQAFKQVVNETSGFWLDLPSAVKGVIKDIQPESRCPFLFAGYCAMLLKKTTLSKKLPSKDVEEKLKQVVTLLKYIQNKDVFFNYYKSQLTRRLLFDSSADREKDEAMVKWLRDVGMPELFVEELAGMFEDVKISEAFNRELCNGKRRRNLNAKILKRNVWNVSNEIVPVSLPVELGNFASEVEEMYHRRNARRKLQWCHKLSTGTITFSTTAGKYDLDVTTFQLAVLFIWKEGDNDKMTFEEMRLVTGLPDAELRRTLWSLVAVQRLQRQPLLFEPEVKSSKDFTESTSFWVNDHFAIIRNGKPLKKGRVDLIGKIQISTSKV